MSRRRPNFSTRTAEEDVSRLDPNDPAQASPEENTRLLDWRTALSSRPYEPLNASSRRSDHQRHPSQTGFFSSIFGWRHHRDSGERDSAADNVAANASQSAGPLSDSSPDKKEKNASAHRASESANKLGTFSGVFVPTTLNVLSILMFLRFGFILGQAGLLGMLGLYICCLEQHSPSRNTADECRTSCCLLYNQLGNNNVSLCHRNERNRKRRRRVLLDFSITRT